MNLALLWFIGITTVKSLLFIGGVELLMRYPHVNLAPARRSGRRVIVALLFLGVLILLELVRISHTLAGEELRISRFWLALPLLIAGVYVVLFRLGEREITTDHDLSLEEWKRGAQLVLSWFEGLGVSEITLEYGFVVERDVNGLLQEPTRTIPINAVWPAILSGLEEGMIEYAAISDFKFRCADLSVAVTLCNDAGIHLTSWYPSLLREAAKHLQENGLKVHQVRGRRWGSMRRVE